MSGLVGVAQFNVPKLPPSWKSGFSRSGLKSSHNFSSTLQWISKNHSLKTSSHWQWLKCSSGRNSYQELRSHDEYRPEPFWLSLLKEAWWGMRSLVEFLVEQPSQLRYIEWPSLESTLKTASFTLVLVAVLIVALSSVDSGLCYLLTLLVRRKS